MDTAALYMLAAPAAKALGSLLTDRSKRPVAAEAKAILESEVDARPRVRTLFEDTKRRLQFAWTIGIAMTVVLFTLFVAMVVAAVIAGLTGGKDAYALVFGGVGAVSVLTVLIWRPYDRAFQALITTQRLDMILVGLEQEWSTCSKFADIDKQLTCMQAANKAALDEIAKLA